MVQKLANEKIEHKNSKHSKNHYWIEDYIVFLN